MPKPATRSTVKKTLLTIFKEKVKLKHLKRAAEVEYNGEPWDWDVSKRMPHPLVASDDLVVVRSCKEGCILQKLYARLEDRLAWEGPANPLSIGNLSQRVFNGLLDKHEVHRIMSLNDSGHFNKLKKYINGL
jgi:hypothetical protein